MQSNPHKLTVIDGETLMDKRLPPTKFCVDTLLPQGLCILGGSPKVGKSWLVLDLCVHVAQGTPLWGLDVTRGDVLYLCLEDSERRIQERLNTITDNVPEGMYFATGCTSIESGVCDWLRDFKRQHPEVSLIAIDTFQLIRTPTPEVSYGGDYAELRILKELADELGICLLLVHHLRKMNDRDPVNKLSGSTGISGAVDAIFVLDKNERIERFATLYASGRDIRDRKIQLELDKDACIWAPIADSLTMPEMMLPDEMAYVFGFVWRSKNHGFVGTNTELAQHVSIALGKEVNPKGLKQMMNRYRYQLEDLGVFFESKRSNGQKYVVVRYGFGTRPAGSTDTGDTQRDGSPAPEGLADDRKFAEGDENTAPRQRTTGWESARPDFFADGKIQSPGSHYPMGAQHSVCPAKPAHSGIGDLAGIASAVSILNNGDSEESEEEKREREARENGNAIGAVVGSVIGLLSALDPDCDEDSDETESEENTFGLFM